MRKYQTVTFALNSPVELVQHWKTAEYLGMNVEGSLLFKYSNSKGTCNVTVPMPEGRTDFNISRFQFQITSRTMDEIIATYQGRIPRQC